MSDLLSAVLNVQLLQTYWSPLLEGLWVTTRLVAIAISGGMILGLCLAFGRGATSVYLQAFCRMYIYFFRGSPLLAQLFLLYYGLGSFQHFWQTTGLWWFFRDPWYCTLLAFTLNSAAYQAEIFRGSLLSISRGQYEASAVLGLSRTTVFIKVVLPQLMLIAIGPLGNELILCIKASAIASLVTIFDLMGVAKLAFSRSFDFQVYLWVAVLYLIIVEVVRRSLKRIEQSLSKHVG